MARICSNPAHLGLRGGCSPRSQPLELRDLIDLKRDSNHNADGGARQAPSAAVTRFRIEDPADRCGVPNTECPSGLIAIAVADQLIPIGEFGMVMERIINISFSS